MFCNAVTFPVTKQPLMTPEFCPTSVPTYMKAWMLLEPWGVAVTSTLVNPRLRITASEPVVLNNPTGLRELELLPMVMSMNRLSMTCPLPSKVAVKTLPLGKLERGSQPAPLFQ